MTFITFLLHPLFLRPSNPISTCPCRSLPTSDFFLSGFSLWVPLVLKCSAETQLPTCHGWAVWKDYLSHCSLPASLHTAEGCSPLLVTRCHSSWWYLRAEDQNAFLKNSLLLLFLIQCLYTGLSLFKIDLGTCPCEFCSFQTIFWYVRTIGILILFPVYLRGFYTLTLPENIWACVLFCPSGCSCRESE